MVIGPCDRAQAVSGEKNDSPSPKSHLELEIPYLLLIPSWDLGMQLQLLSVIHGTALLYAYCSVMSYCRLIDVLVKPFTALAFAVFLPPYSLMSPESWKTGL